MLSKLQSFGAYQMCQTVHSIDEELALIQGQRETCSVQQRHYGASVLDMFVCNSEEMIMSSKYSKANGHLTGDERTPMVWWKVPGSL